MHYTLKLFTLTRDHGDGSSSTYLYNTMDELITEHELSKGYDKPLSKKDKQQILDEIDDDPYEYGNYGNAAIELELVDGQIRLAEPTSIYGNQQ